MLLRLIEDVSKALDAEAYMAALMTSLAVVDVCSKAEYPDDNRNKCRYIKWFDEHIGITERADYSNIDSQKDALYKDLPYLNGEVAYQLRCALMHQGNPNIDNDNIHNPEHKIDHFIIEYEKPKDIGFYSDSSLFDQSTGKKTYSVNLNRLCTIICAVARGYYKNNKDKFNFFEYELIDKDERLNQFFNA